MCRLNANNNAVMPPEGWIQYAAASRLARCRLWNTGSSAFADDDSQSIQFTAPDSLKGDPSGKSMRDFEFGGAHQVAGSARKSPRRPAKFSSTLNESSDVKTAGGK
jgi:hypothetical protein